MKTSKIIELKMDEIAPKALWFNAALLIVFAVFYHLFNEPLSFGFSLIGISLFVTGYLVLIVLHELFHLIGFVLFGKVPISSLNYGVNLQLGIAYATTNKPIQNHAMRKALLLPFWTTAFIPTVLGFWFDSQVLVFLGAMLTAGAFGDFIMYNELRKEKNAAWILDDPSLPRLHVYDQNPDHESTD
ncbi:hypothetical protein B481_1748 [Planococcus halocryophilus Or1]|uniref:Diaminopimelate epimerase n=1 Tax=Planococcus halocryophilus TaxID=1215089 RepID=A0A1C7DT99_9BACL|nr:DUF3267 domain-containing protein [Planococcus halocryophilus]ANU14627.1 hypothetical protein BBI08_12420 [Planococcus halocryophilus]EMF46808.1 hypothetical protein B481_1748 [Planococcus halocryophilus Or1]